MKKMKRLFAVLLTLAMVLGMSVMTFAETTGTREDGIKIEVNGAQEGTTYQYLQLVEPQQGTETGWKFKTDAIAGNFKGALGVTDDQAAIGMLIKTQDPTAKIPDAVLAKIPDDVKAKLTDQETMNSLVANAIKAVANAGYDLNASTPNTEVKVNDAGMYYIRGTKAGYSYNPMAAYVSFGYTGGVPTTLKSDGTTAKGKPIDSSKSSNESTKVTEIGRTVTYYVGSIVPFVPLGENENRQYILNDTITGADYVVNNETDKKVTLTVYYGEENQTLDDLKALIKAGTATAGGTFTSEAVKDVEVEGKPGKSFKADLSSVLANNDHEGDLIVITYQAEVKDVTVGNDVSIGDGINDTQFGSSSEELYTAQITINKKDASDKTTLLKNAEFKISKEGKYATFDENNKFVAWVDTKDEGTAVVAVDGTVTVTGLGEGTYKIEETKAPEGYSINEKIDDVTFKVTEGEVATATLEDERDVLDTQLSALPSTGGIGTTIFTIAGCLIMIAAAGLFFATRRKSVK